jgi:hypothetical protein
MARPRSWISCRRRETHFIHGVSWRYNVDEKLPDRWGQKKSRGF